MTFHTVLLETDLTQKYVLKIWEEDLEGKKQKFLVYEF
jgi:hypothetical protein